MNYSLILVILVGVLDVSLGVLTYLKGKNRRTNQIFALLTFNLALWSFTIFLSWIPGTVGMIDFWSNATFWGPSFVAGLLVYFVLIFPQTKKFPSIFYNLIIFLPAIALFFLAIYQKINTKTINPWTIERGYGIYIFEIYFLICLLFSFYKLIKSHHNASGVQKMQIRYVLFAIAISAIAGVVFNLALPIIFSNARLTYIGPPISGLIFIAISAYAIIKHRLLDIVVIIRKVTILFILLAIILGIFSMVAFGLPFVF
ncbi:MAG: hypothetical protein ACD_46C00092G0004, partial [uncultured bacterium]